MTASEHYDLTFRGELLDGADPAAVRARLATLLKLDAARLEQLFSGRPVSLKRGADKATAARFQQAFREAGARLRVSAAESADPVPAAVTAPAVPARKPTLAERLAAQSPTQAADRVPQAAPRQPAAATGAVGGPASGSGSRAVQAVPSPAFSLAPPGADLLRPEERAPVVAPAVLAAQLTISRPGEGSFADLVPAPASPPPPPDTSALSLDAPGALLSMPEPEEILDLDLSAFELAPAGVVLVEPRPAATRTVDTSSLSVAPPGATLDATPRQAPPPPPDTSHLKLLPDRARFDV